MQQRSYRRKTPGLLDDGRVPAAAAAYSLRHLTERYTGPLVRLREDAGDTLSDFYLIGGELRTAAGLSVAQWLTAEGASNAYVRVWYDQSGNGHDVSQTTDSLQPIHTAAGPDFDGSDDQLVATSFSGATAAPMTLAAAFTPENDDSSVHTPVCVYGPSSRWFAMDLVGSNFIAGKPLRSSIADPTGSQQGTSTGFSTAPLSGIVVFDSTTSRTPLLNNDGGVEDTNSRNPTGVNAISIGANVAIGGPENWAKGVVSEVLIFGSALSDDQLTEVYGSQVARGIAS